MPTPVLPEVGLDDGVVATAYELSCALRLVNHAFRNAVFNRSCGVEVLELDEHACVQVFIAFKVSELEQGSVADKLVDGSVDVGHGVLLSS